MSDVKLVSGTGPAAVRRIHQLLGPVPVLFATTTPWACGPCAAPTRVIPKPFSVAQVARLFRELAPAASLAGVA